MTEHDTNAEWAKVLTDERLASDLLRLADDVRFHNPAERSALLTETARRLQKPRPARQTLVTFPDGKQLAFMHGHIMIRSTIGGLWPSALEESDKPHQPNTFFVGEW
jgi:hypothetical protein